MNSDVQLARRLIGIARTNLEAILLSAAASTVHQAAASALDDLGLALDALDRIEAPIAQPSPSWRGGIIDVKESRR